MHAQDFVDAPIVFTFEALDFGQAVFDLFQRARIEMDALGVTAQLRRGLLQLRQRRVEQFGARLQMMIDHRELAQPDSVFTQPADQRRFAFV